MINDSIYLTGYKQRLDDHVTDHGRPVDVNEARVERNDDRHVKRCEEYQPIPARLEPAVVAQNELRFFYPRRLILGQRWRGRMKQILQIIPRQ